MNNGQGEGFEPFQAKWTHQRSRRGVLMLAAVLLVAANLLAPSSWGVASARFQDGTDGNNIACSLTAEADTDAAQSTDTETSAPAGSPVATDAAAGQPADDATTAEITLLVRTLAACLTEGDNRTVASLVSQRYLGGIYGGGGELSRSDFLELAAQLPVIPMTVVDVSDVRVQGTRNASAEVVTVFGNQLERGRWSFVLRPRVDLSASTTDAEAAATASPIAATSSEAQSDRWLVNGVTALGVEVPADAEPIDVTIDEYTFAISPGRTDATTIVLNGDNVGDEDHEILMLRLDDGVSSESLIRNPGPGLPAGITFVGQQTIASGDQGQLVLVDLEPGTYVLVCLLPDADGTPHLALGMRIRLRIDPS